MPRRGTIRRRPGSRRRTGREPTGGDLTFLSAELPLALVFGALIRDRHQNHPPILSQGGMEKAGAERFPLKKRSAALTAEHPAQARRGLESGCSQRGRFSALFFAQKRFCGKTRFDLAVRAAKRGAVLSYRSVRQNRKKRCACAGRSGPPPRPGGRPGSLSCRCAPRRQNARRPPGVFSGKAGFFAPARGHCGQG